MRARPGRLRRSPGSTRTRDAFFALHDAARALGRQQQAASLWEVIPRHAARLLGATGVLLYVFDRERRDCELVARHGTEGALGARIALGDGLVGRAALQRITVSSRRFAADGQNCAASGVQTATAAPLLNGDELTGVLVLLRAGAAPTLSAVERQLLSLFGALTSAALHNARLLEQVRAGRKRLELLTHGLLESLERERRRIARELHDEIGQSLTAVHLNLENLRDPRDPAVGQARLDDSLAQVERLLRQVRNLSLELRPSLLDDLGLAAALRWYLGRQSERAGLRIGFADGLGERRLTAELETTCFRVAQEAVNNVVRHAHAQNVQVSLSARGRVLELRVLDDGCGFDAGAALERAAGAASLGLLGMREWVMLVGGRFEIQSSPGHGSEIRAIFPLDGARARLERRATRRA